MSVVLILSDDVTPSQRGEIIRSIQQYGEWVTLSESSYAIHTDLPPEVLLQRLRERTGIAAGLQALRVSKTYRGRAPIQVRKWLSNDSEHDGEREPRGTVFRFRASDNMRSSYGSDEASG